MTNSSSGGLADPETATAGLTINAASMPRRVMSMKIRLVWSEEDMSKMNNSLGLDAETSERLIKATALLSANVPFPDSYSKALFVEILITLKQIQKQLTQQQQG